MIWIAPIFTATMAAPPPIKTFDDAYSIVSSGRLSKDGVDEFTRWYGEDNLKKGINPHDHDLRFVFAVNAPNATGNVTAESNDGKWILKMKRVRGTDLYVGASVLPEMAGFLWSYHLGTEKLGGGELEAYTLPPEDRVQPGVPKGAVIQQEDWKSKIFEGTTRHWWIYVPAQYDPNKAACLYVVQDGQWNHDFWPIVLDNMIAKKQIPVTIAVFVTPGIIKSEWDNRSIEYDTVSDKYPNMIADEIMPEVYKKYNIRKDPASHLIAGLSSSGISSFTCAWFRPDAFGKVLSWIGSFTNLQGGPTGVAGGNTYPAIIRDHRGWDKKGEPKPIRVFLQDGRNDLDNKAGNWPLSNQQMAKALEYGGYDYRFELGNGFHSAKHGQAILPDTLKWLFRDEPF